MVRVLAGGFVALGVLIAGVGVPDGLVRQAAAEQLSSEPERSVEGRPIESRPQAKGAEDAQAPATPARPVWPRGGSGRVELSTAGGAVAVAGLPVSVAAVDAAVSSRSTSAPSGSPSSVRVETFDNAVAKRLGGVGVAVRLSRADGGTSAAPARVSIDYSSFREAYPAGFVSRLTLIELPGCVLAPQSTEACRKELESARRLPVVNDVGSGTVTAEVKVGAVESTSASSAEPSSGAAPNGESSSAADTAAASGDGAVYTLAAAASSTSSVGMPSGNFTATDLKPSGTWTVGPAGGGMSYSYPITAPPGPAGAGPKLALEYSSAGIDSLSSATNNQGSWVGMGWELNAGFIEQGFRGCASDGEYAANSDQDTWKHLCWESADENDSDPATTDYVTTSQVTLSVGGRSSQIVKDKTSGAWRTVEDFGWKIESVASGGLAGQPYWKVTTQDGTVYRFGYQRDASLQVPYLGDDTGEPCRDKYPTSGEPTASAFCTAPWRWMLDQEIDPKGNVIDYTYARETNAYCRTSSTILCVPNGLFGDGSAGRAIYDRGGYLAQVSYGHNANVAGSTPTSRIRFVTVDRTAGMGSSTTDVPADLRCEPPYSSCDNTEPAFYVTKRLQQVVAETYDTGASAWDPVSRLELGHKWISLNQSTYDGSSSTITIGNGLWLDTISQVGMAGSGADIALPPTDFDAVLLDNRPESETGWPFPRISSIANGLGGRTDFTYGQQVPCTDASSQDCYRVERDTSGEYDYYNRWLVLRAVDKDQVAGSPDMWTQYQYVGAPAWDVPVNYTSAVTKPSFYCGSTPVFGGYCKKLKTDKSESRGYATVRTVKGAGTDPAGFSVTSATFFRGMGGQVTDFEGNSVDDVRAMAGKTLQEQTWTGTTVAASAYSCTYTAWNPAFQYTAGLTVSYNNRHWQAKTTSKGVTPASGTYWQDLGACPILTYAPTAWDELGGTRYEYTRTVTGNGPGIYDPARIEQTRQVAREKVTSGWRYTETKTEYNSDGLPTKVNDYGERGNGSDNTCTATTYAKNTSGAAWMISYKGSEERRAGDDCTSGALLGRSVTLYDGAAGPGSNTPTVGNATEIRTYSSDSDYTTAKATYDGYGRTLSATDALGKTTTTAFSPAAGWPSGGVTVTNPLGHTTTAWAWPYNGQPVGMRDANNNDVNIDYDALGRTLQLWTPVAPKSAGTPAAKIAYTVPADADGVVTGPAKTSVSRLQSGSGGTATWVSSHTYIDGLARPREVQTASPAGGRIVQVTTYDGRGLTAATSAPLHNTADPGSSLLNPALTSLPQWSQPIYDGLGRAVAAVDMAGSTEFRRTSTNYLGGDKLETVPPVGGKTVSYTDADDQVIKIEEWKDASNHYDTTYEYDLNGRLTKQTDTNGNVRTFTFDMLGRRTGAHDPDAGDSQQGYDAGGRLAWSTDGKGQKISYTYDDLGRKTAQWAGETGSGAKLTEWVYDTVAKGQLTSATRYAGGNAYTDTVTGYDAMGRPTGSALTIPSAEGLLAGTYTFTTSYTTSGAVGTYGMPAAGGLPAETVTSTYTDLGLPYGMNSGLGGGFTYVNSTGYSPTGRMTERGYGTNGKIKRNLAWDASTGWLNRITTTTNADTATPQTAQDDQYTYDVSGEINRVLDAASAAGGSPGQSECFTYDGLHRLSQAWTTTGSACGSGTASADNLGIDPYAQSYAYDGVGNLTSLTDAGQTATYTYPAAGASAVRPNAVTSITRPGGTDTYGYDAAGQLTSRNVGGKAGTFTWNEFGQLDKATIDGADTTMVYDADGERLIRRDPGGTTTLFLGSMEIEVAGSSITGKRYYTGPDGATVAMRTGGSGVTWLMSGLHGSTQLAVNDANGQVSRERYLPFGQRRGTDDLPFTDHGFLGKIEDDSTGLNYLSARYYDPAIAKFISTDPLLDLRKPQWANPFAYAGNNPVGLSDPTGLKPHGDETCAEQVAAGRKTLSSGCQKWAQAQAAAEKKAAEAWRKQLLQAMARAEACKNGAATIERARACSNAAAEATALLGFDPWALSETEESISRMLNSVMSFMLEDINGCINGSAGSCAMFAASFIPGEKIAVGAAKLTAKAMAKFGPRADRLARALGNKLGKAGEVCNSFLPGTMVLMADGSHKPIELVKVGDKVLATDPITGKTKAEPVIALITGKGDKNLVKIYVDTDGPDGDKTGVVIATDHHPFWSADQAHWFTADQLTSSMRLRTPDGGTLDVLTIQEYRRQDQRVYNLTIQNLHTYHVAFGSTDILVHNAIPSWRCITFTGAERQEFSKWANVNFSAEEGGKTAAIQYHLNEHGKGRDLVAYTRDALDFWNDHKAAAAEVKLRNGQMGLRIKIGKRFGIYTKGGKIVTYAD